MGCIKNTFRMEAYRHTILPQDTRKISNKNLKLYLKELEKIKPKASRMKQNIKIRAYMYEIVTKTIEKINAAQI